MQSLQLFRISLRQWRYAFQCTAWSASVALMVCLVSAEAASQTMNLIPVRRAIQANATYDENSRWALQLKSNVVISSPLLRLRDVAVPVENNPPWWDRAGASIIAIMPVDEHEMIVERARLIEAAARSTTVANIDWSGADSVRVMYQRAPEPVSPTVQTVSAEIEIAGTDTTNRTPTRELPPLAPSERERIVKLIQIGIDRYDSQLREAYDITVDQNQSGIESLRGFIRIDAVSWQSTPVEGINVATIKGMNPRDQVTGTVEVSFVARPLIVVATGPLRRGHILADSDVTLMPAARNVSISEMFTDINEVVGLQVQTVLQQDRPISRSVVGPMTVVERGDLVEVRVIGGGITIATGGKTLAPGAKGDLIAVETLEPRRKLMARVAGPGVVEIITRPPRVQ